MQVCSKVPLQHLRDSVCVISTFVVVVDTGGGSISGCGSCSGSSMSESVTKSDENETVLFITTAAACVENEYRSACFPRDR